MLEIYSCLGLAGIQTDRYIFSRHVCLLHSLKLFMATFSARPKTWWNLQRLVYTNAFYCDKINILEVLYIDQSLEWPGETGYMRQGWRRKQWSHASNYDHTTTLEDRWNISGEASSTQWSYSMWDWTRCPVHWPTHRHECFRCSCLCVHEKSNLEQFVWTIRKYEPYNCGTETWSDVVGVDFIFPIVEWFICNLLS